MKIFLLLIILAAMITLSIGCSLPPPCSKEESCFWTQKVVLTGWGFVAIYEPPSLIFGYVSWQRNAPGFQPTPPDVPVVK